MNGELERSPVRDHVSLLETSLLANRRGMGQIDRLLGRLPLSIGWHYPLDLLWLMSALDRAHLQPGDYVLDAGAGMGVLQFLLAERGYHVLSLDFSDRSPRRLLRFSHRVRVGHQERIPETEYMRLMGESTGGDREDRPTGALSRMWRVSQLLPTAVVVRWRGGRVDFVRADMAKMDVVASGSVAACVSLSAIEHVPRERLRDVVQEMQRVLRPGGLLAVTTSAARDGDWFHEPSRGWCYSRSTLESVFELTIDPAHWQRYDEVLGSLRDCQELRRRLPATYFASGDNGMPWGRWDPKYVPVGVQKSVGATF